MLELPPLCCAKCKTLTCKILISLNKQVSEYRRDDMPPADGSSTVAKIAADLRPSADGSAFRTSLVAGGG